jgi:hypothetical protein
MLFVMGAPPAAAFAIVTSPWPVWTRTSAGLTRSSSVAAGFATYAAQLTGAVSVLTLLPLPAGFGAFAPAPPPSG